MPYFARKNTIYLPSNRRGKVRYLQVYCDDENVKGTTNIFYRFLTTVLVKNVIIRISNKLEYRA